MGKRNRHRRRSADPRSKTMAREIEIRNPLIKSVSDLLREVNFHFASVMDHPLGRPKQNFGRLTECRPGDGRSCAADSRISRPPGLQKPAKRNAVEPEAPQIAKRARAGPAVQRRLQTVVCQQLPILYKRGPQRPKRSDSWPVDPSPARLAAQQVVFWATLASRPRTKQRTRKPMSWARPAARQFTGNTGRAPRALGQSSRD